MRPIASYDWHDLSWPFDEPVPGGAAVVEDVLVAFEQVVRAPFLGQVLPYGFHRVHVRSRRRQRQKRDNGGKIRRSGQVPSSFSRVTTAWSPGATMALILASWAVLASLSRRGRAASFATPRRLTPPAERRLAARDA